MGQKIKIEIFMNDTKRNEYIKIKSRSMKIPKVKKTENQRKERGKGKNIFLIQTHEYDPTIRERKYDIMGTTKNVYTVTINKTPSCTCPDYKQRHNRCKHIFFVLGQIMRVSEVREDIREYKNEELDDMFNKIPVITENLRVNAQCFQKYLCTKNQNGEIEMKNLSEDDLCPVCLGDMMDQEEITHCKYSCGSCIHKKCFEMFNSQRDVIKCLYCQKDWIKQKKEYINLV